MELETLDSTVSSEDIHLDGGFTYSLGLRITMIFAGIIGITFLLLGSLGLVAGPVFVLASIYANSAMEGVYISLQDNRIKIYSRSFGITSGKWQSIIDFKDLVILRYGMTVEYENEEDKPGKKAYVIWLMTSNHSRRIYVSDYTSKNEAVFAAKDLSKKMKKNFVEYNLVISDETKAKRYERH